MGFLFEVQFGFFVVVLGYFVVVGNQFVLQCFGVVFEVFQFVQLGVEFFFGIYGVLFGGIGFEQCYLVVEYCDFNFSEC